VGVGCVACGRAQVGATDGGCPRRQPLRAEPVGVLQVEGGIVESGREPDGGLGEGGGRVQQVVAVREEQGVEEGLRSPQCEVSGSAASCKFEEHTIKLITRY